MREHAASFYLCLACFIYIDTRQLRLLCCQWEDPVLYGWMLEYRFITFFFSFIRMGIDNLAIVTVAAVIMSTQVLVFFRNLLVVYTQHIVLTYNKNRNLLIIELIPKQFTGWVCDSLINCVLRPFPPWPLGVLFGGLNLTVGSWLFFCLRKIHTLL